MPTILLNESLFHFSESDFPLLIHGIEHSGSSFFTLTLLADLYNQNKKFLFFCKSEKAQINFLQLLTDQTGIQKINASTSLSKKNLNKQAILIEPLNYSLFLSTLCLLDKETIVVVKNIDSMPKEVFEQVKDRKNLILSGNIDRSIYKEQIVTKQWNSKILFSSLDAMMVNLPPIEQYEAIFLGQKTNGIISIK